MTKCSKYFKESIWALVTDELEASKKTKVLEHLEHCPSCMARSKKMSNDYLMWLNSSAPSENDLFFEKMKQKMITNETFFFVGRPASAILAVASVAVGIAMGFLFLINYETRETENVFQAISSDYSLQLEKDQLFPADLFIYK
ncbi:MAG: zf-HC2 domain-containing protein [Bacteroidales bacterium]|nr:zf-HC2 domain-containing protein [Bacteroidales bacterium]